MRTAVFAATLFLLAGNVLADPQPWMKKENPEELGVWVSQDPDCPTFDLESLVHGVIIRSRIRPVSILETPVLYLTVVVACIPRDGQSDSYVFDVDVNFGVRYGQSTHMHYQSPSYGIFGQGTSDYLQQSVKESVEMAITDYLQANFDL